MIKNCGNCEHYATDEKGEIGQCRRAPVPMLLPHPNQVLAQQGMLSLAMVSGPVAPDFLCGQHSDKPPYSALIEAPGKVLKLN